MKTRYTYKLAVIALILFFSCKHSLEDDNPFTNKDTSNDNGNGIGTNSGFCDPDSIYFNRDIMPIINSNCAFSGCHGQGSAQDGISLENYNKILSTNSVVPFNLDESELWDAINENDPEDVMPPLPRNQLTFVQKELLKKWILQGAKNINCNSCDTNSFKYQLNIKPIIDANCISCHSGTSTSGNVILDTYSGIKTVVDNGKLISVLSWKGNIKMPLSAPLPDCKNSIITKWINNGAKND